MNENRMKLFGSEGVGTQVGGVLGAYQSYDHVRMAARIDTEYGDGCRARQRSAITLDAV
jgi:hypothetical protein